MTRLAAMVDGLTAAADERLAPDGLDVSGHFLRVAAVLHDAEVALANLRGDDEDPGPFAKVVDPSVRRSETSFALIEAAHTMMGFAVRLRSRLTATHARKAAEPLRAGLRALSDDDGPGHVAPEELLQRAARALVLCARVAEVAEHPGPRSTHLPPGLERPIEGLVAFGVLPILQLAVLVQDDEL